MAKRRPTPGMCLGSLRALLVAAVPRRSRKARISSGAVLAEAYTFRCGQSGPGALPAADAHLYLRTLTLAQLV